MEDMIILSGIIAARLCLVACLWYATYVFFTDTKTPRAAPLRVPNLEEMNRGTPPHQVRLREAVITAGYKCSVLDIYDVFKKHGITRSSEASEAQADAIIAELTGAQS